MADAPPRFPNPRLSLHEIMSDFQDRRSGIRKALLIDQDELFNQCHPDREKLCLYGFPDRTWQLCPPPDELGNDIQPSMPVPHIGINSTRDTMERKDWLDTVAFASDIWLESVAIYHADCSELDTVSRNILFSHIKSPPTLLTVMSGLVTREPEEVDRAARCWACGSGPDGKSWVLCACQRAFHQKCIQQSKCPVCSNAPSNSGACSNTPSSSGACSNTPSDSGACSNTPSDSGACSNTPSNSGACSNRPSNSGADFE